MNDPRYRIIVFDAVGTLIKPAEDVAVTYQRFGQSFGSRLSLDEIRSRFRSSRKTLFASDTRDNASDSLAWQQWRQLAANVFGDVVEFDRLFQSLWNHYSLSSSWIVYNDVNRALDLILRSGMDLAIASNFDSRLPGICQRLNGLNRIVRVFSSSEIGFAKPSPKFFSSLAKLLDCEPKNLVMVGDDFAKDVDAARRAGWTAVHVDRLRQDLSASLLAAIPCLSEDSGP